tara:strand:+ start:4379 stop:6034 length:1656 start_codon:yes stop_codon:yes gene_type:complete
VKEAFLTEEIRSTAVCISGQIRSETEGLLELAESVAQLDADIFVSVWKDRGAKVFGGATGRGHMIRMFGPIFGHCFPRSWLGVAVHKVFPDPARIFSTRGYVGKEDFADFPEGTEVEIESETFDLSFPYSDSNSLRMLYKIRQANRMKTESEYRRGVIYEKVIRIRPDILLDPVALKSCQVDDKTVFIHGSGNDDPRWIQDQYWLASSRGDDKIAELYDRALAMRESGWSGIHYELGDAIERAGLSVTRTNLMSRGLMEHDRREDLYYKQARLQLVKNLLDGNFSAEASGGTSFGRAVGLQLGMIIGAVERNEERISEFESLILKAGRESPGRSQFCLQQHWHRIAHDPVLAMEKRAQALIGAIAIDLALSSTHGDAVDLKAVIELAKENAPAFVMHLASEVNVLPDDPTTKQLIELLRAFRKDHLQNVNASAQQTIICDSRLALELIRILEAHDEIAALRSLIDLRVRKNAPLDRTLEAVAAAARIGLSTQYELEILHKLNEQKKDWLVLARLGAANIAAGRSTEAKRWITDALALPDCKAWVGNLLKKV